MFSDGFAQEYWSGVPASMCEGSSNDSSGGNGRQLQHAFLVPRCPLLSQAHDITFSSIEGDFQVPMRGPSQPLLQPSFESYCQHWGARRHDSCSRHKVRDEMPREEQIGQQPCVSSVPYGVLFGICRLSEAYGGSRRVREARPAAACLTRCMSAPRYLLPKAC